jgi:hypothetical protein
MALVLKNRVQETGTANTTVSFTLSGAIQGFQAFSSIGNGNTTYYTATDASGNWEVGIGTYSTTGPTLTRTTILSSSNSGSAVTFSGTVNLWVDYPAEKSINYDADGVAAIGETLGYADTGIIASFVSTVAGYNQVILQNKSTATNASSNLNVSNNASTSTTGFAELGINSTTFSNGAGAFNIPGASYVASAGTDLSIGTYGAYDIHFATNSNTTDSMTIHDGGGVSLGGYGDPGLGNIAVNKIVSGVSTITSSAGTTILNSASTYYQVIVGTTTQTIRLPDATTLLNGTTFIIDNDSTGNVTVTDNASASLDVIPGGGISYLYLNNNSTVAGTWTAHGFLPSIYNFNNSTADFANASITNAVWNGTTIASGYGGTGLTSFTSGGAVYATSTSALATGTLPVTAGGTAATTFTSNGVLYGNGTSALGATAAGTTGQVLIGNTGAAPSWGTISSSLVSSFSAGTTGFTPSTATTGAVTLAGTLAATNGGTGQSSYAVGDLVYASTTTALSKLADVATGNALISGGVGAAPSYGKIGLTTHVSGTLPIANGGTNSTATPTAGGVAYGTGTAYAVNTAGTSGQYLTSGGAGAPTWTTLPTNVASISFGTTGLTPSTATTGAVTVAGTLAVANGGTGNTTAQAEMNRVAGAVTSGSYLRGNGTNVVMSTIQAADVPTLNQNTTGSSGSCTGNAATATTATNLSGGTVAATTITATGSITAFFSDDRLKTRHGKIENALDKLQTLDGFYYTPNQVAQDLGYEAIQDIGVSAQSVQAILPEIIAPAPIDPQYLTVRYEKLVPLLIEAIKELKAEVDELKKVK